MYLLDVGSEKTRGNIRRLRVINRQTNKAKLREKEREREIMRERESQREK